MIDIIPAAIMYKSIVSVDAFIGSFVKYIYGVNVIQKIL